MELYLLRHGIAVERGTQGYRTDSARPLTDEGTQKMQEIARGMLNLGLDFDWILSSPYLRAKQTAEIVGEVFEQKVDFSQSLAAEGSPEVLIREINDKSLRSVLLVGHEPNMSELMSVLISGNANVVIDFRKGGLCRLSAPQLTYGRCAQLRWLMTPKQLRRIQPKK